MSNPNATISRDMVRDHLSQLTDGWFADHNVPPLDVQGYGVHLDYVVQSAERAGDRAAFVLALQHLVATRGEPISEYGDDSFSYSNEQMREIMAAVLERMGEPRESPAAASVVVG